MVAWLRPKVVLFLLLLILLDACTNHDIVKPTAPIVSLPTNLCSSNFQYGYTNKSSYYPGETITAFLQSNATIPSCKLDLYDINGLVVHSVAGSLFSQAVAANASENGYGFSPSVSFQAPATLKSGIYLIEKQIPIILKTRSSVDLMIVYPDNTANAYERSGGKSLYTTPRITKVSFLRPIALQENTTFCLKWFTSLTNISIGYVADRDLDDYTCIEKAKIIVLPGHSEYWTRKARENFDRFVDTQGHALILSGNTMWWQVRYSVTLDEMICHREKNLDPVVEEKLKTVNWYESFLKYPITQSIGADFNRGGYGLKADGGWDGYKITNQNSPLLNGLNLKRGDILRLPSGEYDGAPVAFFDALGFPELDNTLHKFHKLELIGFDRGSRFNQETIGTFIAFQKTPATGIVINAATYDWCSEKGMGGIDGDKIKKITDNAITRLLKGETLFSK